MASENSKFFTDERVRRAIGKLLERLSSDTKNQETTVPGIAAYVETTFLVINTNAEKFDKFCKVNIAWEGRSLLAMVESYDGKESELQELFVAAFRFVCEYEFSAAETPPHEFKRIHTFVDEHFSKFAQHNQKWIRWAEYSMPIHVLKKLAEENSGGRSFIEAVNNAEVYKSQWVSLGAVSGYQR